MSVRLSEPLASFVTVTKDYPHPQGLVRVLDALDLDVQRGEMLAVMGASGSGKSTLLNILGCLDVPSRGLYRFDGADVAQLTDDQRADLRGQRIGFVFQAFHLHPRLTALDNVARGMLYGTALPLAERRSRARMALESVGLADRALHYPGEMSGGQRQRVALARAVAHEPLMVLADEPTGNLDPDNARLVLGILEGLRSKGTAVVVATHAPDVSAVCNRVIRIERGRLVPVGSHANGRDGGAAACSDP